MKPIRAACLAAALILSAPLPSSAADSAGMTRADVQAHKAKALGRTVQSLIQACLGHVEMGLIAHAGADRGDVRTFAWEMVDRYTYLYGRLTVLADTAGIEIPTAPDKAHLQALERLRTLSGPRLDRAYMQGTVQDQRREFRLLDHLIGEGSGELRAVAERKKHTLWGEHDAALALWSRLPPVVASRGLPQDGKP